MVINMALTETIQRGVLHYPTLKTVLAIENVLKESNVPLNKEGIKSKLETKIHHMTLNLVIAYLEDSGKIFIGKDGISWTFNENPKFQQLVNNAIRVR